MVRAPAVNASPLIFLSRARLLDFLRPLAEPRIVVPVPVASEIERRGSDDPAVQAIRETSWLDVVEVPSVPQAIQAWDLGPGESAVLAWCQGGEGTRGILDDLQGRRCATAFGIPVTGTLGLVLLAKRHGRIELARPVLESLRRAGMYLSDRVLDRALAKVGE